MTREAAEKVLSEPSVPKAKLEMRVAALDLLADVSILVASRPRREAHET